MSSSLSRDMLDVVTNYLNERRPIVKRLASYVGGGYLVGRYMTDRLQDVRIRVLQERLARDKYVVQVSLFSRYSSVVCGF